MTTPTPTPTQAQIEAAKRLEILKSQALMDKNILLGNVIADLIDVMTDQIAAAQVGEPNWQHGDKLLKMFDEAAAKAVTTDTIERCARVAESTTYMSGASIAAAIRKLKDGT